MKNFTLLLFAISLSISCYAQTTFQKGYFIKNNGEKVQCLIKNLDWNNNPKKFTYKLSENSEDLINTIQEITKFEIYNVSKYEKHKVNIDRSSENTNQLTDFREAKLEQEELLLRVLIEGKANLYEYKEPDFVRFFYGLNDSNIEQLIYKSYLNDDNYISKNIKYQQQLLNDLKCESITANKIESLDYRNKNLVNLFIKYNECIGSENIKYGDKKNKGSFNLTLTPGLNSSSLSIENNSDSSRNINFDNELGFRFGIEAEFILAFNNNKWSIILEPNYQYYKSQQKESDFRTNEVVYKSIELPIGVRHHMFLNNKSKLFINALLLFNFEMNSSINTVAILDINSRYNLGFGIGYKYNNKYSVELRTQTSREILSDYMNYKSDYNTLSLIFGYTIF